LRRRSGKDPGAQACVFCDGKGKLDDCPNCRAGSVWWTQTPEGARLFLCNLAELCSPADAGLRRYVGADKSGSLRIEWWVLMVDDRSGKVPVDWTENLGALSLYGDVALPIAKTEAADREKWGGAAKVFEIWPKAFEGMAVVPGARATFLLPCLGAKSEPTTDIVIGPAPGQGVKLVRAKLDATLRTFLLCHDWKGPEKGK